ncbi:CDP-glycerol glycerophosphotransferase family protein [bacterium]|nr:CDP-glycerol glycerophosphotransferase family protein [bacterium]
MKILFFDHFFHQDIRAMMEAAKDRGHEIRTVDYSQISLQANQVFPKLAFKGLENAFLPEFESQREQWADVSAQLFASLHENFPFDLFISPSDTFFYLRDFIRVGQEQGVPTVVLQKETAVAPNAIKTHAAEVKRLLPVMCDHMFVCCDKQQQFWIDSGGVEEKIEVTGQPRFDVYHHPEQVPSWSQLNASFDYNKKVVLFLSYNLNTYAPEDLSTYYATEISKGPSDGPWRQLRDETEDALFRIADNGYTVIIKPHPQQDPSGYIEDLQSRGAGDRIGRSIFLIDPNADSRYLIANSDILVGFQTTGLFEGMIAGKEVIYTHWTDPVIQSEDGLMEFHNEKKAVRVAKSSYDLFQLILNARTKVDDAASVDARKEFYERYLGTCDGNASVRVWDKLERFYRDYCGNDSTKWDDTVANHQSR